MTCGCTLLYAQDLDQRRVMFCGRADATWLCATLSEVPFPRLVQVRDVATARKLNAYFE